MLCRKNELERYLTVGVKALLSLKTPNGKLSPQTFSFFSIDQPLKILPGWCIVNQLAAELVGCRMQHVEDCGGDAEIHGHNAAVRCL